MPTYKYKGSGQYQVRNKYGTFVTLEKNDTFETYQQTLPGDSVVTFEKVSNEPYYPLTNSSKTITFAGAETKSAINLLKSRLIRITTSVNITITANISTNPHSYYLRSTDGPVEFLNNKYFDKLFITSDGVGNCTVQGLD